MTVVALHSLVLRESGLPGPRWHHRTFLEAFHFPGVSCSGKSLEKIRHNGPLDCIGFWAFCLGRTRSGVAEVLGNENVGLLRAAVLVVESECLLLLLVWSSCLGRAQSDLTAVLVVKNDSLLLLLVWASCLSRAKLSDVIVVLAMGNRGLLRAAVLVQENFDLLLRPRRVAVFWESTMNSHWLPQLPRVAQCL